MPLTGSSPWTAQARRQQLLLIATVLLAVAAYLPGVSGPFLFDDYPNIVENAGVQPASLSVSELAIAWSSGDSGPLGRPIAMLSFALNYLADGLDAFGYKVVNLSIHLLNGLLVLWLSVLLVRALKPGVSKTTCRLLAAFAAAAWLLHPLHVSSVLYVVQRMTLLSATFVFAGLVAYARFRCCGHYTPIALIKTMFLIALATGLGLWSKENAVLLPLLIVVTELTVFRYSRLPPKPAAVLKVLCLTGAGAVLLGLAIAAWVQPTFLAAGYAGRPFTMTERVLTEPRILWIYIEQLLLPSLSKMSLFRDDIRVSTGLLTPPTTAIAAVAWSALAVTASLWVRRLPELSLAVWFFLAGHALESTLIPLELAFEHRNYVPSVGLAIGIAAGVHRVTTISAASRVAALLPVASIGFLCLLAALTYERARVWSDIRTIYANDVANFPNSVRLLHINAQVLAATAKTLPEAEAAAQLDKAEMQFQKAIDLDATNAASMAYLIHLRWVRTGTIDAALADRTLSTLEQAPISVLTMRSLRALIESEKTAEKPLPVAFVHDMLDSALRNPNIGTQYKVDLLVMNAVYAVNVSGQQAIAEWSLQEAIRVDRENPDLYIVLAKLHFAFNRPQEALIALAKAEQLDANGALARPIGELRAAASSTDHER